WIPASHIPTNADGTITIRNGHTINFDNDVIDADELIVRAGATFYGIEGALHVHDGAGIDFRCDGIFSIATSQITVDGAIQFTSNSVFTWGSGGFNGTGTIEVLNGFNWFLNSGDHTLDGCTFTNYGYAHLQGGNLVFRGSDPHFINQSIFEVASSFDMVNDGASNAWFENGNTGSISALTSTTVNIPANVRFTTDGSMFLYGSEIHFESLSDPLMGNIGIMDIDAQIVSDDVVRFAGPEMVNNGHFIAPDLQMVGSGMQYIYGSGPYQKISTISAVGINAFTTLNIDGELNLVNGNVFTTVANGAVVHLTASSVISYSGVHPPRIIGALQRDITTSGPVDFPVGGAAAEDYAPIVINPDVTSPGSLTVTTQQGDHYAEILSRLISSKSVNRTWSITNNGLGYSSCEITFNWDSADVDAGTIYGNFGVGEWRAASWAYPVANSVTATSITVTGVILSAEYAVAELEPQQDPGTYRTYADGDWNDVANWLVYDGNTWLPASTPPDNSSVAVQVHHKMVVNSPASGNNVVVENAPATVFDAGWGATLTVNSSLTLLHSGNHPDLLVLGDANPNGRVKVELNSGGSIGGDNAQDSIVVRGELDAGNATAYLYLSGGTILNTIDAGLFDQVGGHVRALPGTSTIQCDIHVDGTEFWISGGPTSTTIQANSNGSTNFHPTFYNYGTVKAIGINSGTIDQLVDFLFINHDNLEVQQSDFHIIKADSYFDTQAIWNTGVGSNSSVYLLNFGKLTIDGISENWDGAINLINSNDTIRSSGPIIFSGTTVNSQGLITANPFEVAEESVTPGTTTVNGNFTALRLNNSGGLKLDVNDLTITENLDLTNGKIRTDAFILNLLPGAGISNASEISYVNGNLMQFFSDSQPLTYPIGDDDSYTPVELLPAIISPGKIILHSEPGDHPQISSSEITEAESVNRYWTLTNIDANFSSATITLNWVAPDEDAGVSSNNLVVQQFVSPNWITPNLVSRNTNSITISGVQSSGDFQIGQSSTISTNRNLEVEENGANGAYTSINDAINAANSNDTIIVHPRANGNRYNNGGIQDASGSKTGLHFRSSDPGEKFRLSGHVYLQDGWNIHDLDLVGTVYNYANTALPYEIADSRIEGNVNDMSEGNGINVGSLLRDSIINGYAAINGGVIQGCYFQNGLLESIIVRNGGTSGDTIRIEDNIIDEYNHQFAFFSINDQNPLHVTNNLFRLYDNISNDGQSPSAFWIDAEYNGANSYFENNTVWSDSKNGNALVFSTTSFWVIKNNLAYVKDPVSNVMFANGFPVEFTYNYVHLFNTAAPFEGAITGSLDPSNNGNSNSILSENGRPWIGSDAIDGGDPNPVYNDVSDGSRNDAGAFGGASPLDLFFPIASITDSIFYYTDADQDGYGDFNSPVFANGQTLPVGSQLNGLDCDDNNAQINPTAIELCDGIDENCNGILDDNNSLSF
ncbi:MAG TPA: putative metal-binding motif-containing protein, partial [Bacteroidia bacterium]|nr:putative metal-binding motif-containing protein [Bacteroidia bacterium]